MASLYDGGASVSIGVGGTVARLVAKRVSFRVVDRRELCQSYGAQFSGRHKFSAVL